MAERSFVRDSLGRFAKTAGKAVAKEAKKFAKEEAEDAKRVAKAKANREESDARIDLSQAQTRLQEHDATKQNQDTDHEFEIWERKRKSLRDQIRKQKLKVAAIRAARAASGI